jgi:hypothetical protein
MIEEETDLQAVPPAPESRGLYLLGVQRAKTWRGRRVARDDDNDVVGVRYRDLEALVRLVAFEMPELDSDAVQGHQRAIETVARRSTILPAPYGIVFQGRRPLIRMLQEQYLIIDEALSFLDGMCEIRIHLTSADENEPDEGLVNIAAQLYSDLRRMARAAVPFPREGRRLLSAGFLVEKTAWVEFIQRAEDLGSSHTEILVDITGPWPPYDFVRFIV